MTVREVVVQVITDLGNISVPVAQMQNIGIPIAQAVQNLDAVVRAWDEEEKKEKEQEENADEPEMSLDLVPADEVPEEDKAIVKMVNRAWRPGGK